MSDEQDKATDQDADDEGPKGGERLAEARREQQISVLEVAKELHLDEPKVRALEANDFDVLGAPVFAKGHLRKYAQLVGVDEADVFADYYAMTRSTASAPPLVVGRRRIPRESSPGPWIAVIVILLVAAAGYWWFFMRDVAPELPQPAEPLPETTQPEPAASQPPLPQETQEAQDTQVEETIDEAPILLAEATPDELPANAPAALQEGHIRLSIRFSGDCWTEISDADGRQLYVNMGRDGQSLNLSGKAPISTLFGNVDNVSVEVDGSSYTLPSPGGTNRMVRVAIVSQ